MASWADMCAEDDAGTSAPVSFAAVAGASVAHAPATTSIKAPASSSTTSRVPRADESVE